MKKVILATGIVIMAIIITLLIRTSVPTAAQEESAQQLIVLPSNSNNQETATNNEGKISTDEIQKHNTQESCWVVYNNKVYDITSYISKHPGGESKITRNCGTATQFQEQFERQHGTSKVNLLMKVATFIGDAQIIGST